MKKSAQILITRHEQGESFKWELIILFIENWNLNKKNTFENFENVLWKIDFTDIQENDEFNVLKKELNQLKKAYGIIYHLTTHKVLKSEDYKNSDFIQVFGISLDGLDKKFVLNEANAITEGTPCTKCGFIDSFSKVQDEAFIVNETLLTHNLEGFTKPVQSSWDLINVIGGRLLISKKFWNVMKDQNAQGYKLKDVFNENGKVSKIIFQLEVEKIILIPCFQVLDSTLEAFCDTCGASINSTDHDFDIKHQWLNHSDFFSRHPNRTSMIYISNRLFWALKSFDLNGVIPNETIDFC